MFVAELVAECGGVQYASDLGLLWETFLPTYLSRPLSGPAAGMTPEEEADQVLRQVVGGPQGGHKQKSFGVLFWMDF